MMDIVAGVGCLVSMAVFWVLPIVLGVKAARKNNRSPHWMWFGIHPFGAWIAFLVLKLATPLKACSSCGTTAKASSRYCPNCSLPFGEFNQQETTVPNSNPRRWRTAAWIIGSVVVGVAGFVTFLLITITTSFRGSSVYQEAMKRCREDHRVTSLLGTPITDGKLTSGAMNTSGDATGSADLTIPIRGPKGEAKLYVNATLQAGVWSYQVLKVDPGSGQERIDLLVPTGRKQ